MAAPATKRHQTRRCGFPQCTKTAKPGGLCISHGGGKKCAVDGCTTSAVSRGLCVAHGGGKRCQREGCTKSAQTGGFCWIHGGGKKCGHDGCTKRAQSGGACISHGGGKRCRMDGCNKVVQYDGLCVAHGGYRRCLSLNCSKKALSSGYCVHHGDAAPTNRSNDRGCSRRVLRCALIETFEIQRPSLAQVLPVDVALSGASHSSPTEDWHYDEEYRAIKSKTMSTTDGCPAVERLDWRDSDDAARRGHRLPSITALCARASGAFHWSDEPLRPIQRPTAELSSRPSYCSLRGCSRFAKIDQLCLLHHSEWTNDNHLK
ncbi:hypothetical protein PINS_up012846 [Pythium insidiosum]|nr:hypothetical protein PINS_up012846 [Pythium insidiosum]